MNVTITLLIYWSIAVGLIAGGLFSLMKGFQLILVGKGKNKEENSIELLGMKAHIGSIGSMVMLTAFMWGWAAKLALPDYKDDKVEITLTQQLKETETALAELKVLNASKFNQPPGVMEEISTAKSALGESQTAITAAINDREEATKIISARLTEQQEAFKELRAAINENDHTRIQNSAANLRDSTIKLKAATSKLD